MIYTKTFESFQLFCRKSFEFEPRQKSFDCLVATLILVPQKLISSQRNKAANWVRLVPKAPVVSSWFLHFSRALLVTYGFGRTGFSLNHLVQESFVWRNPQACLGRHTWRNKWDSARQSANTAEFGNILTEPLQMGWLTHWVWRN